MGGKDVGAGRYRFAVHPDERETRRIKAISLRLAGCSRSRIALALGVRTGGATLDLWLRGVPAPAWTKRPRAKDDLK